ncbi:MAG: shikimate kinase [Ruminococcaceae bacterium]|nr:shikimate kinase [Oscillospiraceae bacterium]
MDKYGLLGRKLGHSYSVILHALLADYEYSLYEREPDALKDFLDTCGLKGFNVTIPYKKDIIPYLCGMTDTAKRLGSVNTVVNTDKGYYGDNTDYYGFYYMLKKSGFDPAEKKAIVLGNGGVCPTVCAVLEDARASEIVVISRRGEDNYGNIDKHKDAKLIVNTTPVGMYPDNLSSPLSLDGFDSLECVLDLIYNPFVTALMQDAENRGIKILGGISMLAAQAKRAAELFLGREIDDGETDRISYETVKQKRNIVLVGMPGCGKSTLGKYLAEKYGRQFVDTDEEIEKTAGMSIPEIFEKYGEEYFRALETEQLKKAGKLSSAIISTGGGAVTREENFLPLRQNSVTVFIKRDIGALPTDGRPLMKVYTAEELYKKRLPLYEKFSDISISCKGSVEENAERLWEAVNEIACN